MAMDRIPELLTGSRLRLPGLAAVILAGLAAISCRSADDESVSKAPPQALISDQVHGGGTKGFFFLPPMVAQPTVAGTFAGTLNPAVRIDELDGSFKFLQTIATYTMTTGPGAETLRVTSDPLYIVNWHTDQFNLNTSHFYRINVLVGSRAIGFADVEPVATAGQMKNVDTNKYIALVGGKTLPIKFWMNGCAPIACAATDQCHNAGVCDSRTLQCSNPTKTDGTACVGGNTCTQAGTCQAGMCVDTAPAVLGGWRDSNNPVLHAAYVGSYALLAMYNGGLQVVDLSDPTHATRVAQLSFGAPVKDVAIAGHYAYVASDAVQIFDVTNPAMPVHVGGEPSPAVPSDFTTIQRLVVTNGRLYVGRSGLQIFDLSDPTAPAPLNGVWASDVSFVGDILVDGDYAYLTSYYGGFSIVDLRGGSPSVVARMAPPALPFLRNVALAGNIVYLSSDDGLRIFDVTNRASPTPLPTLFGGVVVGGITVSGSFAAASVWSADQSGGSVRLLDVTDPTHPISGNRVETPTFLPQQLERTGSRLNVYGANLPPDYAAPALQIINVGQGGATCADTCTNTSTDAHNCGACGHDCLGGACASGVCQPVTLLSVPGGAGGIAVNGQTIFYSTGWGPNVCSLWSLPVDGGTPTSLVTNQSWLNQVRADGASAYWAQYGSSPGSNGSVTKIPRTGGATTILASNLNYPTTMAVDGSFVYWGGGNGSTWSISRGPLAGGAPTPLTSISGSYANVSLVVDATNVYFTLDSASSGIFKMPLGGAVTPTPLATGQLHPSLGAVDATNVYWSNYGTAPNYADGTIVKAPLGGGGVTVLATDQCGPSAPVVDATAVYWANYCGGTVSRVALNGGAVTTLAAGIPQPGQVVVDAKAAYWSSAAGISKVAK